ncbi:MAG: DUF4358 domain-containing protein [Longicatena sp.]
MKRYFIICLIMSTLLTSCASKQDSFALGTKKMDKLYEHVNQRTMNETWEFAFLNDKYWSLQEIEDIYGLDMTKIEEAYVKSSNIEAELSEIAFFKTEQVNDAHINEGIGKRIQAIERKWGSYVPTCAHYIKTAQQGRIGKYYYFIFGKDSEKVVNYIT